MRHRLSALLLLTLTLVGPADAEARARFHRGLDDALAGSGLPIAERVARYLEGRAARFELRGVTLAPDPRLHRVRTGQVLRFEQSFHGLPVFGRGVAVQLDFAGRVRLVVTYANGGVDVHPMPVVPRAEALREAAAFHGQVTLVLPEIALGVFPSRTPALAWRVDGTTPAGRVRVYVDAVSGEVLASRQRYQSALGTVYPENPTVTPATADRELLHLDPGGTLTGRPGTVYRYESGDIILDFDNAVLQQTALAGAGGDFLYPPAAGIVDDPFAEVNAYYHLERIDSYLRESFGLVPSKQMYAIVNLLEGGVRFDNAFSYEIDSQRHLLAFGQGFQVDYAWDADVVYHEYGHFINDEVGALEYHPLLVDQHGFNFGPSGLHEGLADYWAITMTGNSSLGEYSGGGGPIRELNNNSRCPFDLLGEPHFDGEIIGGATWEIRQLVGDPATVDAMVYAALATIPPDATFQQFGIALQNSASNFRGQGLITQNQNDGIDAVLQQRGLLACGRFLPVDPPISHTFTEFGYDLVELYLDLGDCQTFKDVNLHLPSYFQYRLSVPPDAQSISFRVSMFPTVGQPEYRLYVQRGDMVGFQLSDIGLGFDTARALNHIHNTGWLDSLESVLTIDVNSTPPLQPGTDYYLAISRRVCSWTQLSVSATVSTIAPTVDAGIPVTPDAGPVGPDAGGPGAPLDGPVNPAPACSCASGPQESGLPLGFLGVLLAAALIARRRHSA